MGRVIKCTVFVPESVTWVTWCSRATRVAFVLGFSSSSLLLLSDSPLLAGSLFFRTFTVVFICFPFPMSRLIRLGCSFSGRPFNDQLSSHLWPVLLQYVQYFSMLFTFAGFSAFVKVNRFAYRLVRQSRSRWPIFPHFWHCIARYRPCRDWSWSLFLLL